MWDSICYLNGTYLPLADAKISVLDRGFIFGDGVYEVAPLYFGKPFEWAGHLARLKRSLGAISLANPLSDAQWGELVHILAARNPSHAPHQFIYWQISRGVAKRDHAFPTADTPPTVFAMSTPFVPPSESPRGTLLDTGVAAISTVDNRWLRCDIKSISLLGNVLKRQEAVDAGAAEVIMFRDGMLTEGAAANIWVVKNGVVAGPPRDQHILTGIRVGLMQRLCDKAGLRLETRPITKAEVFAADELMLSSATKEILPITVLDERPVGLGASAGKPGSVWRMLFSAYQAEKALQCPPNQAASI